MNENITTKECSVYRMRDIDRLMQELESEGYMVESSALQL